MVAIGVLVIVIVAVVVLPLLASVGFRSVAHAMERNALSEPAPQRQRGLTLDVIILVGIVVVTALLDRFAAGGLILVWAALAAVVFVAAWVIHQTPNHDRMLKYALLLLGSGGFVQAGSLPPKLGAVVTLASFVVTAVLLLPLSFLLSISRPPQPGSSAAKLSARWYRRLTVIQGSDPLSVALWTFIVLFRLAPLYLLLRFIVKHQMSAHPIVYLRSFSQEDAPVMYSNVVNPAVCRLTTVVGLVHAHQSGSTLQRKVGLLTRFNLQAVADSGWQAWVESKLRHARGAIVDISVPSESVRWELAKAVEILGHERVYVLTGTAEGVGVLDAVCGESPRPASATVGSAFSWPHLRNSLASWALSALQPIAGESKVPFFIGPRPRVPVLVYAYALIGMPLLGGAATFALPRFAQAQMRTARNGAMEVRRAAQTYQASGGGDCPTVDQLVAERYLGSDTETKDPWGKRYRIRCTDDEVIVASAGRDGTMSTADDVTVPREVYDGVY